MRENTETNPKRLNSQASNAPTLFPEWTAGCSQCPPHLDSVNSVVNF